MSWGLSWVSSLQAIVHSFQKSPVSTSERKCFTVLVLTRSWVQFVGKMKVMTVHSISNRAFLRSETSAGFTPLRCCKSFEKEKAVSCCRFHVADFMLRVSSCEFQVPGSGIFVTDVPLLVFWELSLISKVIIESSELEEVHLLVNSGFIFVQIIDSCTWWTPVSICSFVSLLDVETDLIPSIVFFGFIWVHTSCFAIASFFSALRSVVSISIIPSGKDRSFPWASITIWNIVSYSP